MIESIEKDTVDREREKVEDLEKKTDRDRRGSQSWRIIDGEREMISVFNLLIYMKLEFNFQFSKSFFLV